MSNFISIITLYLVGIFQVELFLYFVAAFAFIAVVFLTFKIIYG